MHRVMLVVNRGHNLNSTNLITLAGSTAPKNVAAVSNVTIKLIDILMVLA